MALGYDAIFREHADVFHNSISALADVDFNFGQARETDAYVAASKETKKHVRLLDAITLLMIFQPSTDVCATSFIRHSDSVEILWAKNSLNKPTSLEQIYFNKLLLAFKDQHNSNSILELCVTQCRAKIVHRIKKASRHFEKTTKQENILRIEVTTKLEELQNMLRAAGVLAKNNTLIQGLDTFVTTITNVSNSTDVVTLCRIICFAHLVTSKHYLEDPFLPQTSDIFNPLQFRQVRKIGAYRKAIFDILATCRHAGIRSIFQTQVCLVQIARDVVIKLNTCRYLHLINVLLRYSLKPLTLSMS